MTREGPGRRLAPPTAEALAAATWAACHDGGDADLARQAAVTLLDAAADLLRWDDQ